MIHPFRDLHNKLNAIKQLEESNANKLDQILMQQEAELAVLNQIVTNLPPHPGPRPA